VRRAAFLTVPFVLVMSLTGLGSGAHASTNGSSLRYAQFLRRGYMVGDLANFARMKRAAIAATERSHPGTFPSASASVHQPTAAPSFQGGFDSAGEPPDTTGAVGTSRFVEAMNSRIDVYNRTGTHLGGASFETVHGACVTSAALCEYSDPQVLWDQQTKRFYYEDLNADVGGSANFFIWGFSKTSHPNTFGSSDWCTYSTQTGLNYGTSLPDYPKMGASKFFLMIGVNVYDGETYTGSDIDTITKPQTSSAISSCPAANSFRYTRNGPISDCNPSGVFAANPNPAQQAETKPDGWVVADPDPTNSGFSADWVDVIRVRRNKTTGAPIVGAPTCVSVPQYAPPPPAVQKSAPPIPPYTIDTLDGRITHAVIAIDPRIAGASTHPALWTSHTVQGGAGSELDWYEIDVVRATAFQTGVVSDPNLFVFNGAIASDRNAAKRTSGSAMVTGFSTSSSNALPAIQMVSKRGASAQSAFVVIKRSPGPYAGFSCSQNPVVPGRCRWGDYSGAVPDPASPASGAVGRVWLANQWATGEDGSLGSAEWRTWIWRATP
jgi:hypothetical protein